MDERTPRLPRHIDDDRAALVALVADLERGGWPHEYPNGYHMMPGCRGCDALRVIKAALALPPDPKRLVNKMVKVGIGDFFAPTGREQDGGREVSFDYESFAAAIIEEWPDD